MCNMIKEMQKLLFKIGVMEHSCWLLYIAFMLNETPILPFILNAIEVDSQQYNSTNNKNKSDMCELFHIICILF